MKTTTMKKLIFILTCLAAMLVGTCSCENNVIEDVIPTEYVIKIDTNYCEYRKDTISVENKINQCHDYVLINLDGYQMAATTTYFYGNDTIDVKKYIVTWYHEYTDTVFNTGRQSRNCLLKNVNDTILYKQYTVERNNGLTFDWYKYVDLEEEKYAPSYDYLAYLGTNRKFIFYKDWASGFSISKNLGLSGVEYFQRWMAAGCDRNWLKKL